VGYPNTQNNFNEASMTADDEDRQFLTDIQAALSRQFRPIDTESEILMAIVERTPDGNYHLIENGITPLSRAAAWLAVKSEK